MRGKLLSPSSVGLVPLASNDDGDVSLKACETRIKSSSNALKTASEREKICDDGNDDIDPRKPRPITGKAL